MNILAWLGIVFCISQAAMFSGLNLALLSISRLRLEVEASGGNLAAKKILALRQDFNFLLASILWGNVAVNVLLTLLSGSVMTGGMAFVFSTFLITFGGEIFPQAYFSRHAMRLGALLAPVVRLYQILLYPVAKPSAMVLDWWLGKENIQYFRERDLHQLISKHIDAEGTDVSHLEGIGAMNFLALDDLSVSQEGERIDPDSIILLPLAAGIPQFPDIERWVDDPFLQEVNRSGKKWIVIIDEQQEPHLVMNASGFLREALFGKGAVNPYRYCHRPIVVRDANVLLGSVISRLRVQQESAEDDVIDNDLILFWADEKRIITGADLLGRLLQGISLRGIS